MGTPAGTTVAAGPFSEYGPNGAAGGVSKNAPLHEDDTTTRPFGSGATRQSQSDARDSEPDLALDDEARAK
jgi:hypothetical protein